MTLTLQPCLAGEAPFADRFLGWSNQVHDGLAEIFERHTRTVPASLREAMGYSLFAGGKRLRPVLALLAARGVGADGSESLAAGAAAEMIHTYSLIHDDLPAMDDDDLRRGVPTCHKKFGEAMAILAGDGLFTLAFEVLAANYPPELAVILVGELARGAGPAGMVGGQVLDLTAEGRVPGEKVPSTVDGLKRIHALKTGALFRACVRMGWHVGRSTATTADGPSLRQYDDYSEAFGLAFQVADDLLDVEGDPSKTGKGVGKDADRGKMTFPGLIGVAESRRELDGCLAKAQAALPARWTACRPLIELVDFVRDRDR